jgi:polyhydroxyalkanoate synthesis regulator phasin
MMSAKSHRIAASPFAALAIAALPIATLALCSSAEAAQSQEARNLNELRNTVVNLLQTLVERGVLSRDQAEAMVNAAQKKAADDATAAAAQEQSEAGAVRVPYVPEIVKEEIRKQVVAELAPEVTKNVIEEAHSEQWGVPGALPDWVQRMRWSGDMRVRGQSDGYASDNLQNTYLDFLTVNDKGGVGKAGLAALLNTSEDRERLRARFRLGVDAELGWGWSMGGRITTGNLRDPVSTNQTLGNTGARYQTGFDLAYIKWYANSSTGRQVLNAAGGRIVNPFFGTDLVWDPDLTFEGIATNYRIGLSRDDPYNHFAFITLGAFPLQEVELSSKDKWLYGAQLGFDWKFAGGSRLRLGAAYYQYDNISGIRNTADSTVFDFTAPQFLQKGNTLYDIRNDTDPTTNLFALAADYHLADATLAFDWKLTSLYRVAFTADYVKNVGYDEAKIMARTGFAVPPRDQGYQAEINIGSATMARSGAWRAFFGYRYLQADAVLDAFTDSDFQLGGTDAKGYFVGGDYAFTPRVSARIRYLGANEIDGAPLGIDVLQLDLNAQF